MARKVFSSSTVIGLMMPALVTSVTETSSAQAGPGTPQPPAVTATLEAQVENLLATSNAAQLAAADHREWHLSPFSPENLAARLGQLSTHPEFATSLCRVLRRTPAVDLNNIVDFLESPPYPIDCIKDTLTNFYNALEEEQMRLFSVGLMSTARSASFGPTQQISLDVNAMPVVVDGNLPRGTLALTFDDGPHPSRTQELLRILKDAGVTVQFFMVGRNVVLYPDITKEVADAGHEVGCHSFTHPDMRKLSYEAGVKEIEDAFSAIDRATGQTGSSFFRFPYGASTTPLRKHLLNKKTPEFFWNIDTLDWKYKDPAFLLKYTLEQIDREGGGVVLFHDIQPQTIAIMPALLQVLRQRSYQFAVFRPAAPRL